jgi:AraC family transcriptional regulator of adaptative response/methylated-DNA-[protein]-cysteine methyltransferase
MFPRTSEITEPEAIRFAYGDTALGIIAVAESGRGVAAILIGDTRGKLLNDLHDAFPEATLVLDQPGLAQTTAKAVALVNAPHLGTDLMLDLRGSAMEVAVWRALQAIPAGETRPRHRKLARPAQRTALRSPCPAIES